MIVVGVDPDSDKHGVAVYKDGELIELTCMDNPELVTRLKQYDGVIVSIENVKANKAVYRQHSSNRVRAQGEIGRCLGLVQQSQIELEKWLYLYGIAFVLHKPQKGNWAKNKEQFEKATGWKGRSNADTRSAAFFGYLAL